MTYLTILIKGLKMANTIILNTITAFLAGILLCLYLKTNDIFYLSICIIDIIWMVINSEVLMDKPALCSLASNNSPKPLLSDKPDTRPDNLPKNLDLPFWVIFLPLALPSPGLKPYISVLSWSTLLLGIIIITNIYRKSVKPRKIAP